MSGKPLSLQPIKSPSPDKSQLGKAPKAPNPLAQAFPPPYRLEVTQAPPNTDFRDLVLQEIKTIGRDKERLVAALIEKNIFPKMIEHMDVTMPGAFNPEETFRYGTRLGIEIQKILDESTNEQ